MDWSYLELTRDQTRSWWYGASRHRVELGDPTESAESVIARLLKLYPHDDEQLLEHLTSAPAYVGVEAVPSVVGVENIVS
jgi:hypothetical protein